MRVYCDSVWRNRLGGLKAVGVVGGRAGAVFAAAVLVGLGSAGCGTDRIGAGELRSYPPIALVLAPPRVAGYQHSGDLYVAQPDGKGLRRVKWWVPLKYNTRNGRVYGAYLARWSPDHRRIALALSVWFDDPYEQAAVVNADGTDLHAVGQAGVIGTPAWSLRGELAYAHRSELMLVKRGQRRALPIWRSRTPVGTFGEQSAADLDWSPGGARLVVLGGENERLLEFTRAGSKRRLTDGALLYTPRWSPDGKRIAFARDRCLDAACEKSRQTVEVIRPDGSRLWRLPSRNADGVLWSPDGRSILIVKQNFSNKNAKPELDIVAARGGSQRKLADNAEAIDWSPDAKKILFARDDQLWVMDADGDRQTRLPLKLSGLTIVDADWHA